jgi:hypothetical protein
MHRVLKPGGGALIVDLRKDPSMDDINAYIKQSELGWANSVICRVTFRYLLLPRAYSQQQFVNMASNSVGWLASRTAVVLVSAALLGGARSDY